MSSDKSTKDQNEKSANTTDVGALMDKIMDFYDDFKLENIDQLSDIYTDDVTFTDPIHQVQSLDDLQTYFKHTMENVEYCHFAFTERAFSGDWLFLAWQMRFVHEKLADGRELVLPGVSQFHIRDGKVAEQQDHYDLGAMLYEHIPVLGYFIKKVRDRLVSE